ncbi:unnamed protein product [Peniophora sp. CBMAI 1063]|nr:unnamed protein product [Peniophora sp. CBMAI 1063]
MATDTSSQLPAPKRIVTAYDDAGKSVIQKIDTLQLKPYPNSKSGYRDAWTFDKVPTNDNNLSIDGSERTITGPGLSIVHAGGVRCFFNDLAPGMTKPSPMHRTMSTDVDVLISGQVFLIMEDGTETLLDKPGDSIVQRGTAHAWRNPSTTEWVRFMSVVVDAEPVVVDGKALKNEFLHA